MSHVTDFLSGKALRTETALREYVATWNRIPQSLFDAMNYSLFAGGKRLRPALALAASELICGSDAPALPVACAIEMIHTYSLIHDDLPCMDDDDLRRGKPTSHKVYGEALAILAGDGLLTMAFDIAAQTNDARIIRELAQAAGVEGMVGGQALDMKNEQQQLGLDELRRMHECKTGALIRVSARAGAMAAGGEERAVDALTRYGENIGLAFQIADDILDIVGDQNQLGKPVGSDVANDKATYPAVVGIDRARIMADEAVSAALNALAPFGAEADILRELARYIVARTS